MTSMINKGTLSGHVDMLKKNFESFSVSFPNTYLAAEYLNDLFDQLFSSQVSVHQGRLWEDESIKMLFGSFISWIQAFLMTSTGLGDLGLMALRRSIEYACYIAKIKDSDDRATLWLTRNDSQETRKKFNGQFGVPRTFFDDKYDHLRYLLVWHEHASDFGVHGNFANLVAKIRDEVKSPSIVMSLQDDPKHVPLSTGTALLAGYFIVEAITKDLHDLMNKPDEFSGHLEVFMNMLRDSRHEVAQYDLQGAVPLEVRKVINSGDFSGLNVLYEELKHAYER